jgi:hypothetical protein
MLWLAYALVTFIALAGAYGFLALVWVTRGQGNIASMFFFRTGYFALNPVFRPANLGVLGRRYRLAATVCLAIAIVAGGLWANCPLP